MISRLSLFGAVALAITLPATAQDARTPSVENLPTAYTGKVYSPNAERNYPERALWGDSHMHTSLSLPLDRLAITDDSDGMGLIDDLRKGTPGVMAYELGARWTAGQRQATFGWQHYWRFGAGCGVG